MTLFYLKWCHTCKKETQHALTECQACAQKERNRKMAAWQGMTTENKVLDMDRRLRILEEVLSNGRVPNDRY